MLPIESEASACGSHHLPYYLVLTLYLIGDPVFLVRFHSGFELVDAEWQRRAE